MTEKTESGTGSPVVVLGGVTPILRVADLNVSLAYYVDRLGFQLQWRNEPVASVGRDRVSFMLCQGDQGQPGTWVWIATENVDRLYSEFADRKALLRHPPTNYPWGSRECQVTDPDGHVLRFGADLKPDEPLGAWRDGDGRCWLPQPDGSWQSKE